MRKRRRQKDVLTWCGNCRGRYVNGARPETRKCLGCDQPVCDDCFHRVRAGHCNWCVTEKEQRRWGFEPVRPDPPKPPNPPHFQRLILRQQQRALKLQSERCKNGHFFATGVYKKQGDRCRQCRLASNRRAREKVRGGPPGPTPAQKNAMKTHCPRGHPYAGDNLYRAPDGSRNCRACHRIRNRRAREKKRGGPTREGR